MTVYEIGVIVNVLLMIFCFIILKSAEKLVKITDEQHTRVLDLCSDVMKYYEACMKSNTAVDKHYELVKEKCELVGEQYEDVKALCNIIIEQEEKKNGMAV